MDIKQNSERQIQVKIRLVNKIQADNNPHRFL
jgi:hypothetical protein